MEKMKSRLISCDLFLEYPKKKSWSELFRQCFPEIMQTFLDSLNSIAKSGKSLLTLTEELLNESTSLLLAKTGQPSSASAIAENYALERLCELSAKLNWLNDELKNAAGSGIAAYIHATKRSEHW